MFAISADYLLFGKSAAPSLASDQKELIDEYSKLDRRDQHRILMTINEELERIENAASSHMDF